MKLLSFPERKLLTAGNVGEMEFIRIEETWDRSGFERVVYAPDGRVLDYSVGPSPYFHGGPPYLKFNVTGSPWEIE